MNAIIKSKTLLFLIALAIPTVVFLTMAYMTHFLIKGNAVLFPFICIIIVTYLLISSAQHINKEVDSALGTSIGILIGTGFLLFYLLKMVDIMVDTMVDEGVINANKITINEQLVIFFIFEWALSVFIWVNNLFKKQEDIDKSNINDTTNNNDILTNDNDDLIGGWYGVDSNLSCWLPVLAFEKNYIATFSDGKIVKEYSYHICCSTCIILTAKDGEKIFVKRVWVKGKPHLFYNEQAFTQDGKHCE